MRESISEFCSLVYAWSASGPFGTEEEQLLLREIDKLSHLIPLQLNPSAKLDLEIQRLIKAVPKLTEEAQQQELFIALEDLVEVEAVEKPHICGWRRRTA